LGIDRIVGYPTNDRELDAFLARHFPPRLRVDILRRFREYYRTMPPKFVKRKPKGLLATAKAKKSARKDPYGSKSVDWDAVAKVADRAAKNASMKTHEILYSQGSFSMNSNSDALRQTGFVLSGLNQSAAFDRADPSNRIAETDHVFVWPLSPMSALGNASTPGYRSGQKINAKSFKLSVFAYQGLATMTSTYHIAIIRNVGLQFNGPGYTSPGITTSAALSLFVFLNQGPLVTAGPVSGSTPNSDFISAMRWNRADWRVLKHTTYTMPGRPSSQNQRDPDDPTTADGATNTTACKRVDVYVDLKDQVWDYSFPGSVNDIKGGNYFAIIWREGWSDKYIGLDYIGGVCELAYRDP
jgi:hypothetical protein